MAKKSSRIKNFDALVVNIMKALEGNLKGAGDDVLLEKIMQLAPGSPEKGVNNAIRTAKRRLKEKEERLMRVREEKEENFENSVLAPILASTVTKGGFANFFQTPLPETVKEWVLELEVEYSVVQAAVNQAADIRLWEILEERMSHHHMEMDQREACKKIAGMYIQPMYFKKLFDTFPLVLRKKRDELEQAKIEAEKRKEQIQAELAKKAEEQEAKRAQKLEKRQSILEAMHAREKRLVKLKGKIIPAIEIQSELELDLVGSKSFCDLFRIHRERATLILMDEEYFWVKKEKSGRSHKTAAEGISEYRKSDTNEVEEAAVPAPKATKKVWVNFGEKVYKAVIASPEEWQIMLESGFISAGDLVVSGKPNGSALPLYFYDGNMFHRKGEAMKASPDQKRAAKGETDWSKISIS